MADEDFWESPNAKRWVQQVLDGMVPNLEKSAVAISLVPSNREGDVKFWVELGASIMLNKPIIAVALGDQPIPPKLELLADEIVRCPEGIDPAASDEMIAAIKRVVASLE